MTLLTGCGAAIQWFADDPAEIARAPQRPRRCKRAALRFHPERQVLLGQKASALWRWAESALPGSIRVGRSGRLGMIPTSTPGVALHLRVKQAAVAFIMIQSHGDSISAARPLATRAVERFLYDATGCETYRLCRAHATVDELRFRGHTTCPQVRVPVQLITPRSSRRVVSVAAWLPSFSPTRHHRGRPGHASRRRGSR